MQRGVNIELCRLFNDYGIFLAALHNDIDIDSDYDVATKQFRVI
jgi:hypothetical protein